MSRNHHYTSDDDYLVDSPVNLTFRKLHYSSDKQFQEWVSKVRIRIRRNWNQKQIPPIIGTRSEQSIIDDLKRLSAKPTDTLSAIDDLTHRNDIVVRRGNEGSSTNNFFPSMWMTFDTSVGKSITSILLDKEWEETCRRIFRRHFKRDGLKLFSRYAKRSDKKSVISETTGKDWIIKFRKRDDEWKHYDFWLEYQKSKSGGRGKLTITKKDISGLHKRGYIRKNQLTTIEVKDTKGNITHRFQDLKNQDRFYIKYFDGNKKVFPTGYKLFQTGFQVMQATNFPPTVAKHIYTRFTEKNKKQKRIVIYDPSSGWGGRIIGACASGSDRNIHYVGTDPNPDTYISELGMSRYEYVADFYQRNIPQHNHISYELFQCGSEEIGKQRRFRKYKDKIDLVFTSPPYFNAEGYSTDGNQSSVKYPEYDQWKEKFLQPTLETAVEYLKTGGYLLWNIADVREGRFILPLERDTVEILENLGMRYEDKLKYVMSRSPGGGRASPVHRNPTTKNFASFGGDFRKYEPIFVFKKTRKGVNRTVSPTKSAKQLQYAKVSDLEDVWEIIKAHRDVFPHVWKTKIREKIKAKQVIFHKGVLITFLKYKRTSRVGSVSTGKGDIHLQQIAKHPKSKTNASNVLQSFIKMMDSDVYLSVRSNNKIARRFYEKNNMRKVGKISWSGGSMSGVVYSHKS